MKKILLILVFFNLFTGFNFAQKKVLQLGKAPVKEVIKAMTLEEKVTLVMGMGNKIWTNPKEGPKTVLVPGVAGRTWNCDRLGIPPTVQTDGPAGVRIGWFADQNAAGDYRYFCTAFPTGTALAASWNPELVEFVGKAMGQEVLDFGCDVLLAPSVNIHRDLLCGRNFEYHSEDPLLAGKIGAGIVRGIQSKGVGTSVKHFTANNAETNRNTSNSVVSQRALREIYLKPFEIIVKEAKPWTVMTSYNRLNGYYTCENPDLLETILRKEWGFDGMVMTDWGSGKDPVAQMRAGNDLIMPGDWEKEVILNAVENNILDEAILDRNLERILEYIMKCPHFKHYPFTNKTDLKKHAEISKNAAKETMVLLKNESETLPLKNNIKTVALFGKTSYKFIAGGSGSGEVNYKKAVTMPEALTVAGYKINSVLGTVYQEFVDVIQSQNPNDKWIVDKHGEMPMSRKMIEKQEMYSDIAIITLGRIAGEGADRKPEDFIISDIEKNLLTNVTDVFHKAGKKVIVIMNMGGMVQMSDWNHMPDAILHAFLSGQESASTVVDILRGKVNPSGKLPMTLPNKYSDSPSSKDHPGVPKENPIDNFYHDDIYVGYRYYNTFDVPVTYEFGFGLSYTKFEYSDLYISKKELSSDNVKVRVKITNVGKMAGKEVVQLYVSAPREVLDRPKYELKGFAKTKTLEPGESQVIEIELNKSLFASFWTSKSSWIVDKGNYGIHIGSSSRDIRLNGTIKVRKNIVIEKVHDVLYPNKLLKTLKANS